jgi:hypothetical protein
VSETPPYGTNQDASMTRLENLFMQLVKRRTEEPQEVTVVSAHTAGEKLAMNLVDVIIMVPISAALVMWMASLVSFVPDIGYGESAALYALSRLLFGSGFTTSWIKDRKRS